MSPLPRQIAATRSKSTSNAAQTSGRNPQHEPARREIVRGKSSSCPTRVDDRREKRKVGFHPVGRRCRRTTARGGGNLRDPARSELSKSAPWRPWRLGVISSTVEMGLHSVKERYPNSGPSIANCWLGLTKRALAPSIHAEVGTLLAKACLLQELKPRFSTTCAVNHEGPTRTWQGTAAASTPRPGWRRRQTDGPRCSNSWPCLPRM